MALAMIAPPLLSQADKKEADRLENCGTVMKEIMDIPDDIPQDLIDKAECVVIYPSVLKGAFVVGGSYGRGAMTCRTGEHFTGPWSAPTMMALEGGSVAHSMIKSKVKLGGDASVAAGPKGRTASAESDVTLRAEVLSYSRSRGLFAGISLEGSTVRPDNDANERVYGKKLTAEDIIFKGAVAVPPPAQKLVSTLNLKTPKNMSDPNSLKE
jgi:lipid-binding SYLF domain-containing protein